MKISKKRIDQAIEPSKSVFKQYVEAIQKGNEKLDFGEYINLVFFAAAHNMSVKTALGFGLDDAMEATGYDIATCKKAIISLKRSGIKELYNDDEPPMATIRRFKTGAFDKYHFYRVSAYGGFESIFMTLTPIDESLFLLDETIDKVSKKDVEDFFNEIDDEDYED